MFKISIILARMSSQEHRSASIGIVFLGDHSKHNSPLRNETPDIIARGNIKKDKKSKTLTIQMVMTGDPNPNQEFESSQATQLHVKPSDNDSIRAVNAFIMLQVSTLPP